MALQKNQKRAKIVTSWNDGTRTDVRRTYKRFHRLNEIVYL